MPRVPDQNADNVEAQVAERDLHGGLGADDDGREQRRARGANVGAERQRQHATRS